MLEGIHPLLTGELLLHLDRMGHSDAVVIADAHYPSFSIHERVVELPGASVPDAIAAIRTVFPLDDAPALDIMEAADAEALDVHEEMMAAGTTRETTRYVERFAFYENAAPAYLVVRTGETRKYADAVLRKGVVGHPSA